MWIQIDKKTVINSEKIDIFFIRKRMKRPTEPFGQYDLVAQATYAVEEGYSEYILFSGALSRVEEKLDNLVVALASACPVYQMRSE